MPRDRISEFVESSFLAPFLFRSGISDLSYNGADFYCETSHKGRNKLRLNVPREKVGDFLRQIANLSERQFSYQTPVLDVSFGRYRLNATFQNIVRVGDLHSYSFCIRIEGDSSKVEDDPGFFGGDSKDILLNALKKGESIVVSGVTSSGKTELQKYLLTKMDPSTRVIVIDNVGELELIRRKTKADLTSWIVDDHSKSVSFQELIRNSLRNNPDYVVVAESRGGEMLDVLNSAMTGHPIITTIHSKDLESMVYRMTRMAMMGDHRLLYEDVLGDVFHHFSLFVYLRKETDATGRIHRYVESIGRLNENRKAIDVLYRRET